jgi:hypothetical protein
MSETITEECSSEILNFLKHKRIKVVNVISETEIHILFNDATNKISLTAHGDCCSESWFQIPPGLHRLVGEEIIGIGLTSREIKLSDSGRQDYDRNEELEITLKNDARFRFLIRNSSNGYYNGWLSVELME